MEQLERKPLGSVNGIVFVPLVEMAPLRCTMPMMTHAAARDVENGLFFQPFFSGSKVNRPADLANEAPSSEVKH